MIQTKNKYFILNVRYHGNPNIKGQPTIQKNSSSVVCYFFQQSGWSGGAMVLGKLPVPGRPTILMIVGQWPIALAVGAGGGGLDIFNLVYPFSSFSLSLGDGPI